MSAAFSLSPALSTKPRHRRREARSRRWWNVARLEGDALATVRGPPRDGRCGALSAVAQSVHGAIYQCV